MNSLPMQVLLIPMGTPGDAEPFLALGQELAQRGHQPVLIGYDAFGALAERAGLAFEQLGADGEYEQLLADPDIWDARKAGAVFQQRIAKTVVTELYKLIRSRAAFGPTAVVAQTMALGARIAQDHLHLPTATLHRQPAVIRSDLRPPKEVVPWDRPLVPRLIRQLLWSAADIWLDRNFGREVNRLRVELGMPPVKRVLKDWLHSPDLVLGFWPEWFATPQSDWPANMHLVGFDTSRPDNDFDVPVELKRFLAAGESPIVITAGTAMRHAPGFYATSAEICQRLGRRGLLVTRYADQLPSKLPLGVQHLEFAPFDWLLPRAAAVVHHAGIGTAAAAVAAGIPQVCLPGLVFDTPDNAARIERLGAGVTLPLRNYTTAAALPLMHQLLQSGNTAERCRRIADRIRAQDAVGTAADLLEKSWTHSLG